MTFVLRQVRMFLEMIRFSHTVFALPFALLGLAMAWKLPLTAGDSDAAIASPSAGSWVLILVGVLLCMIGGRSAAMAFNRIVDRDIDARNPRTAGRHLPSGQIGLTSAVGFFAASMAIYYLGTLAFWPNWLPLALSTPVLAVLLGYSYTKRFTVFAHYWLGLALMLAPICAWIAVRGLSVIAAPSELGPVLVLGAAVFFWVGGFDIIYACQDEMSDRQEGLRSIPAWLGAAKALRWAAISHTIAFACFVAVPLVAPTEMGLSYLYFGALGLIGGLLLYQHRLVSPNDLTRVNEAFFNTNAVISMGLLVAGVADMWMV
jgi:4-hydroxybenzoate polyprenyltransferase